MKIVNNSRIGSLGVSRRKLHLAGILGLAVASAAPTIGLAQNAAASHNRYVAADRWNTRISATANGSASTRGVTTQPGGGLMLNFRDANIDAVLDELSQAAGFIVVKTAKPEGRVTLVSKQPVNADETVPLLNSVLLTTGPGYVAIQQGRILKIVNKLDAKKANIPVRVGSDPEQIAMTDEMITQVIPLRSVDARQLREDLEPIRSPDADFTANQSSNALIITDTSANIKRIAEIVSALDSNLSEAAEVRVFSLEYANAANTAKLINDLFGSDNQSSRSSSRSGDSSSQPPWMQFFSRDRGSDRGSSSSSRGGAAAALTGQVRRRTCLCDQRRSHECRRSDGVQADPRRDRQGRQRDRRQPRRR